MNGIRCTELIYCVPEAPRRREGGPVFGSRSSAEEDSRVEEKEVRIVRLVLDIVKPHNPTIIELAEALNELPGVSRVEIDVQDYDTNIERLKVILDGEDLDYEEISRVVKYYGGNIASLDGVTSVSESEEESD